MAYLNNLNPTKIALGDKNFQTLANLEGQYMSQYPGLSTSGGVFSDARHAAATSLMSDRLGGGITGDILANIGGYAREIPSGISELFGLTPQGESLEDLAANLKSFTYPTGTSAANIYSDIFSKYNTQQQRFKQQQLMNRRKQQMQGTIRRAEAKKAAEAAADRKAQQQATIAANKAAAKKFGDKPQKIYHQETRSEDRGGRDIGSRVSDSYEKQQSAQYGMLAKGGLVNFFKNGGYLG